MPGKNVVVPTTEEKPKGCYNKNLKTFAIIIGVFDSISTFILLNFSVAYVVNDYTNPLFEYDFSLDIKDTKIILIAIIVASIIGFLVSVLFVFGAATNRPRLLSPYIIIYCIGLTVLFFGFFAHFLFMFIYFNQFWLQRILFYCLFFLNYSKFSVIDDYLEKYDIKFIN